MLIQPPGDDVPPVHSHRQPKVPWVITWVSIASLVVAIGLLTVYVVRFNDYVQGRGAARDAENIRLKQDIRDGLCDLLDQLPASPVLQAPRDKYGCGPGIPLDQLPPSVQQQWHVPATSSAPSSAPAATTTAPAAAVPNRLGGASANRATPTEIPTGARPSGAPPRTPSPSPSPTDPLLCGLVQQLCDLEVP